MKRILVSVLLFAFLGFGAFSQDHTDVAEVDLRVEELYLWNYVDISGMTSQEILTTAHLWYDLKSRDENVFYPDGKYVDYDAMFVKEHWTGERLPSWVECEPEEMKWEIVTHDSKDYLVRNAGENKLICRMVFHGDMLFLLGVTEDFDEFCFYNILQMDRFQFETKRFLKQYVEFVSFDGPLPEFLWRPVSLRGLAFQVFYPGAREEPMVFMVEPDDPTIYLIYPHKDELDVSEFKELMDFISYQHTK